MGQLAFPDAIYLVDAIKGGEELMKACKPALESSFVTKVIHDCKRDSEVVKDLPFHELHFSLVYFSICLIKHITID